MKYFHGIFSTIYNWTDVAHGLWHRYPNPYSKHVLSEDVLERWVVGDELHTIKLITKTNPMPKWGEKLYSGPRFVAIVEESVVNPVTKTFITYSRNVSMSYYMNCIEKCQYTPDPAEPSRTIIKKTGWFDSQLPYALKLPILEFSLQRYKGNQKKATQGLEFVMSNCPLRTIKDIVKEKGQMLTEKAKHSKEVFAAKAKEAKEKAKSKARIKAAHCDPEASK